MKKINILLILAISVITLLSSCKKDDNMITGQITYSDYVTGTEYIAEGATVYLMINDSEYADYTTTDSDGEYEFYPVEDGEYYIYAEYSGTIWDYWGSSSSFYVDRKNDYVELDLVID